MSPSLGVLAVLVNAAVAAAALLLWRRGRRPGVTAAQRLAAARRATRGLRRESSSRRPDRGHFQDGDRPGDRHSAAILENSAYGDAAGGSGL
ncbi:hypothetical protein [Catellatospora citrea]|uniref:Uncharacterized protein n=1 Tax=Catellatospora citrea TaxID=53366 RepID=A0A8J3P292_9ACTN|nr:hypothetical protein [Catellatospora citrea]RKE10370.1 hypothetical protein C8E86_5266 [Catellatospora citrea]GIF99125.1 hypothetical protein Cci01nite_42190 [Catellatospora citrea]